MRFKMKKKIAICVVLLALFAGVFAFALNAHPYTYEPSTDFINIVVGFAGSGSISRSFSFTTPDNTYENKCVVQLDPAKMQEQTPVFNDKDNLELVAESMTYPLQGAAVSHTAYTKELIAATKYFYRVGCPSRDTWSNWGYFITDNEDGVFSFLHISDPQAQTEAAFADCADTINKAFYENADIEFILSTGDQAEFPLPYFWDNFFASIGEVLRTTTFAAVNGNHEVIVNAMLANFYVPTYGNMYTYAYEYGDCLFMIADTNFLSGNSLLYTTQFNFFASVMEQSTKKWRILAAHKSPYSTGTHSTNIDVLGFQAAITPFAAEHNIDLVLSGHDHLYCRSYPIDASGNRASAEQNNKRLINGYNASVYTHPQGVVYIEPRCVGSKFYSKVNHQNDHLLEKADQSKIQIPIYSVVKIDGDSLIYTAYEHNRDNDTVSVYDCFEIIKP